MGHIVRVISFVLGLSRGLPRSRLILASVAFAGILSGLANTGLIVLINETITGGGGEDGVISFRGVAGAFIALVVALPILRFISQALLVRLSQSTLYHLRLRWSRRILTLPLARLEKIGPDRLLASLTNDLGAITEAMAVLPLLFMHGAVLVTCLAYLGYLSLPLFGGLVAFMLFGVVTYQLPMVRALVYQRRAREEWDGMFRQVRAITQGTKELKMHQGRRDALVQEGLEPSVGRVRDAINVATTIFAAASSWGQILFFVAIGLLLFVVPRFQPLPTEVLVGYCITLIHMMTPLETILTSLPRLTNASVSVVKIDRLGLSLSEAGSEPEARELPAPTWRHLELDGVTYTYRGEVEQESFGLGPIDLSFEPGELVFLVGGNGSGKTSLAKLILGLYAPEEGEIRVDGEPVTDGNRDRYRQRFSVVFSDFFLFDTLLGLDAPALDDDARRYLAELQLDRKVRIEDGALSTTDLSQGQRKRLALLTAYLEDRSIYLFDEWAADQDPVFKDVFYRELLPALRARGKTVLVISHDDRYYGLADRLVKLDRGQVVYDRPPSGEPMELVGSSV